MQHSQVPSDNHLFYQNGTSEQDTFEKAPNIPPVASLWRRFLAWLIDVILLGLMGHVVGLAFAPYLFKLGPYGRPIGLLFILPYFGIMNSKIGGGQTVGKRLMRIAVRDGDGNPISLWRSFARISILILPAVFNGWVIPVAQINLITIVLWTLLSLIVFGLGGSIFYSMIFNRKARQGLHDLLVGTYVVYLRGDPVEKLPQTPRWHWAVMGIWASIVAIGSLAIMFFSLPSDSTSRFTSLRRLYNVLQEDPRFFSVAVKKNTIHLYGSGHETIHTLLVVTVWYKGEPSEEDRKAAVQHIIKTIFEEMEGKDLEEFDGIQVKIKAGYDIGVAHLFLSWTFSDSIEGWRKRIFSRESALSNTPIMQPECYKPKIPNP